MTPPRRNVRPLVAILVPVVTLVLGLVVGAWGLRAYTNAGSPPLDVPRYSLPASWQVCPHLSGTPLAYFGVRQTSSRPWPSIEDGDAKHGCFVDFANGDDTSRAFVNVSVSIQQDDAAAHTVFTSAAKPSREEAEEGMVVGRVAGIGTEAAGQYTAHPKPLAVRHGKCVTRSDGLVVRHGRLVLDISLDECRVGTPPDAAAMRGADYQIAVAVMNAIPKD
ncbi:MAG TPA: hypothetical protein VGN37_30545 [Actinocatenispora sp.]